MKSDLTDKLFELTDQTPVGLRELQQLTDELVERVDRVYRFIDLQTERGMALPFKEYKSLDKGLTQLEKALDQLGRLQSDGNILYQRILLASGATDMSSQKVSEYSVIDHAMIKEGTLMLLPRPLLKELIGMVKGLGTIRQKISKKAGEALKLVGDVELELERLDAKWVPVPTRGCTRLG